jgi:signal transduction histidine kinase
MKLGPKLTIVTISFIIASLTVTSIMALQSFSLSLESQITHNLQEEDARTTDKLSRFLFERYGDISLLTDRGNMIIYGSNFSIAEKIEYLRSVEKAYGVYSSFSIYNTDGIKIAGTHSMSLGTIHSTEQFFTNAIKGNIYYGSVPVFWPELGQYLLYFSGPLHGNDGKINGVLLATIPISEINNIVEQGSQGINDTVQIDLVSPNGLVIYSNHNATALMHKSLADLAIFQKMNSSGQPSEQTIGSLGSITGAMPNSGDQAIYVAAKEQGIQSFKGTGMILIMSEPAEIAFSEVTQLRTNFIIVAIAILSASIMAVIIFSKLFTKPLVQLKDAASEIAKGNFDIKVRIDKDDEIGELSKQFDKMKNDLKDRERLKDEFINIAAHELRSPLQPIISYNELALKGLMDKDEALRIIDTESQRFIQLANDILDVTRIEGGALTYRMKKIKLMDIINRIVSSAKISNNISHEVSLQIFADDATKYLEIYGDENRLSQVFMNIIGNAVKFTRRGFIRIMIKAYPEQNKVEIRIADTGGGIPNEIFPKLFGKFVTKSVRGGTEHGTGLGLFISKAIVQAHKGEIHAQNNSDGGATFIILLPINSETDGDGRSNDARFLPDDNNKN